MNNEAHYLGRLTLGLLVSILVVAVASLTLPSQVAGAKKGDSEAGKKIYEQFCVACHGPTGKGDGPTGKFLPVKPSDFSKQIPTRGANWADYYFKIIKGGGAAMNPPRSPLMAPWGGQMKDNEIWDVISHIETISKGK